MKLLSFILSIQVLFLTSVSTISILVNSLKKSNHIESCCSVSIKNTDYKQTKGCKNGICNPFTACCSSFTLAVPKMMLIPQFTYLNKKFYLKVQVFQSDFSSDAWNPPKRV